MDTNYFVCTLGQAALINKGKPPFCNINALLDRQAEHLCKEPAVGFLRPTEDEQPWGIHVLSFLDIARGSKVMAERFGSILGPALTSANRTVALLLPSTPELMFSWLGLMRAGYSVLLIAPQCQPPAIAHLCQNSAVSALIYDEVYGDQARRAFELFSSGVPKVRLVEVSTLAGRDIFSKIYEEPSQSFVPVDAEDDSVAYLFHTSGTSSGLPKPIPQTHHGSVGVLPCLPNGRLKATFTTTPLYHGGIADVLRAWSSNALIWLFPGKGVPITAKHINRCLKNIQNHAASRDIPPIKYFSAVPYVLQMMDADPESLQHLKVMDLVGVGGAALPVEVGDKLVAKTVSLVSRYGSAECGFLLSSHRVYEKDRDWQYLRSDSGVEHLRFEDQGDGTYELVVLPGWPHMAKTNRDDGSFATADLFVRHPTISNAWKYHSRADAQLTLITGKKFDPAPLEDSLAASELISDALIFGNGRPHAGVLIFRSKKAREMSDAEMRRMILPLLEKLNSQSQTHAKIPRSMVNFMPFMEAPLKRSSKGTVIRSEAEERYQQEIERTYCSSNPSEDRRVGDDKLLSWILQVVNDIIPQEKELEPNTDLFSYGADSIACIQIRQTLAGQLEGGVDALPLNVVEDCATPANLAKYLIDRRHGEVHHKNWDETSPMLDLVEQYCAFKHTGVEESRTNGEVRQTQEQVWVLTGVTGALGSHILHLCRKASSITKIYCLVRGANKRSAEARVQKALLQRSLPGLDFSDARVIVVPAKLSDAHLGLDEYTYKAIAAEATTILHLAWEVNFRLRLQSFVKDSIAGLHNLLNLALSSPRSIPPTFGYCSSVASVIRSRRHSVSEEISTDPSAASPIGYAQSKWVAEQICQRANETTRLQSRIVVFRVGQLSGDTQHGIWNEKEAWPMLLSTLKLTGCLPALPKEPLNWLPIDTAARALLEAMQNQSTDTSAAMNVYHILNQYGNPTWTDLLGWLKKKQDFDIVPPTEWIAELEKLERSNTEHSAFKLLGHWKEAYGSEPRANDEQRRLPEFEMRRTLDAAPVMRDVVPVNEAYFSKIWDWMQKSL